MVYLINQLSDNYMRHAGRVKKLLNKARRNYLGIELDAKYYANRQQAA